MKLLVCEGICNSGRAQTFDAAVRESVRIPVGDGRTVTNIPDAMLAVGRHLTHTPHLHTSDIKSGPAFDRCVSKQFTCQVCGTERRYGLEGAF